MRVTSASLPHLMVGSNLEGKMDKFAILALFEAKPGKEHEVEEFLKSAQPLAVQRSTDHNLVCGKAGTGEVRHLRHISE